MYLSDVVGYLIRSESVSFGERSGKRNLRILHQTAAM